MSLFDQLKAADKPENAGKWDTLLADLNKVKADQKDRHQEKENRFQGTTEHRRKFDEKILSSMNRFKNVNSFNIFNDKMRNLIDPVRYEIQEPKTTKEKDKEVAPPTIFVFLPKEHDQFTTAEKNQSMKMIFACMAHIVKNRLTLSNVSELDQNRYRFIYEKENEFFESNFERSDQGYKDYITYRLLQLNNLNLPENQRYLKYSDMHTTYLLYKDKELDQLYQRLIQKLKRYVDEEVHSEYLVKILLNMRKDGFIKHQDELEKYLIHLAPDGQYDKRINLVEHFLLLFLMTDQVNKNQEYRNCMFFLNERCYHFEKFDPKRNYFDSITTSDFYQYFSEKWKIVHCTNIFRSSEDMINQLEGLVNKYINENGTWR